MAEYRTPLQVFRDYGDRDKVWQDRNKLIRNGVSKEEAYDQVPEYTNTRQKEINNWEPDLWKEITAKDKLFAKRVAEEKARRAASNKKRQDENTQTENEFLEYTASDLNTDNRPVSNIRNDTVDPFLSSAQNEPGFYNNETSINDVNQNVPLALDQEIKKVASQYNQDIDGNAANAPATAQVQSQAPAPAPVAPIPGDMGWRNQAAGQTPQQQQELLNSNARGTAAVVASPIGPQQFGNPFGLNADTIAKNKSMYDSVGPVAERNSGVYGKGYRASAYNAMDQSGNGMLSGAAQDSVVNNNRARMSQGVLNVDPSTEYGRSEMRRMGVGDYIPKEYKQVEERAFAKQQGNPFGAPPEAERGRTDWKQKYVMPSREQLESGNFQSSPKQGEVDINSIPTAAPGSNAQYHSSNPMTRREQFNQQVSIPKTASSQIGNEGVMRLGVNRGPEQTGGDNPANLGGTVAKKKDDGMSNGFF